MGGFGFIAWIIIGAIAGFLAEKIMKRDHGLLTNIIVGVIGGLLGGWIMSLFGFGNEDGLGGWIWTIFTATLGACLLLWILGAIRSGTRK
ncbi:MAG: GlsB/YeaQ/YmgE family stress response membrane protein [Corynebacterium sp.]|nr:GlsB/YeaQ/YmgE family stress response membrane protein [Corynebacterium sp.]